MHKPAGVFVFIVVFLLIFGLPLFAAFGQSNTQVYDSATQTSGLSGGCVESGEYMKSSHMQLLGQWRDSVVRDGQSTYLSSAGKSYAMSLDDTCLSCHGDPGAFCDSCHSYTGVAMDCWGCHAVNDLASGTE
ncbi:MAG TPA: menaquinol oxidoreductase [Coriobacteriia bacterium]|nr:menaquinol oxidoreductase [Coriobacteriia bacterium]